MVLVLLVSGLGHGCVVYLLLLLLLLLVVVVVVAVVVVAVVAIAAFDGMAVALLSTTSRQQL